jgi:diacylglycerol O-acyltransferase / wax synthase
MESMNIVMPVHLYGGVMLPGQSMGNRIGAMIARVPGENQDLTSVDRLGQVHDTLYALKRTPTPLLSYLLVRFTSSISGTFLPSSWTQFLFSKANANAAAVVSNVRGPHTPLHIKGRLVQSVHGFVPLPPGIPIGVVVGSYADNVQLSLSAEPWAVPDGDQFLVYVLEEYQALLEQAIRSAA